MTCRRCNRATNVMHFHNDAFDGWFCAMCVDVLVDAALERSGLEVRQRAQIDGTLREEPTS